MSPTATSQRPLRTVPAPAPHSVHHEFPVRFTWDRAPSFWPRRPQNSYRWVGPGALLVDERGVRVSARRLTLFGRPRTALFILPSEIRQVYREGESIRVDLRSGDFFRCWAESVAVASDIVSRLPTQSTIEFDAIARPSVEVLPAVEAYRRAWWLVLAVAIFGAFAWVGVERLLDRLSARQAAALQPTPVATGGIPFAPRAGRSVNRVELEKYSQRFEVLTSQFGSAFDALQRGNLSQSDFVDGLDKWLLPQWDAMEVELQGSDQLELRTIVGDWRHALLAYAHGLRVQDSNEVWSAFGYLHDAEEYESRVRQLYKDGTP
jgi:hypothetical protein